MYSEVYQQCDFDTFSGNPPKFPCFCDKLPSELQWKKHKTQKLWKISARRVRLWTCFSGLTGKTAEATWKDVSAQLSSFIFTVWTSEEEKKNRPSVCLWRTSRVELLPLTSGRYTGRGSHGNRATSSASPHQCSHRNRSDTCQSISRRVTGKSPADGPRDILKEQHQIQWGLDPDQTSWRTHWVFPALLADWKVLVGNLWISLRLNFLDTTAPWRSSNSRRAWKTSRWAKYNSL